MLDHDRYFSAISSIHVYIPFGLVYVFHLGSRDFNDPDPISK